MSRSRTRETLLITLITVFSALFRYAVFGGRSFPSGDDEAMSSGFIFLILSLGRIPSVNIYHMPGTPYTYPPSFHLTCGLLILFTSLPILTTTLVTGILMNVLTVPSFYCLSKQILGRRPTALLASFLFAASTSDMYMLTWGGYVNLTALFFIPMIFWLSLKEKPRGWSERIAGGFLVGALMLTHHFTAFVFIGLITVCLLASAAIYARKREARWRSFMFDLLCIMLIGGCLALGWWLSKLPLYATILSGPAERSEVAVTWITIVTSSVRALTGIAAAMFFISWFAFLGIYRLKKTAGGFSPEKGTIFLWIIVPVLLSTPYLVGPSPSFQRFLYYIIQPALILITLGLVTTVSAIRGVRFEEVRIAGLFFVGFLVASYLMGTLAFANGNYSFFLSMNESRGHTIEWLGGYTKADALVVTEHSFGWWIAGIGHRPTLSASPSSYLIYPYEEPLARAASLILSANYGLENGFLRIDESGPYGCADNPRIAFTMRGLYHQMLTINDREMAVVVSTGSDAEIVTLDKPTIRKSVWIEERDEEAILRLRLEDTRFEVTRSISLSRGSRFTTLNYEVVAKPGFKILGASMLLRFLGLNQTFCGKSQIGGLNLLQQAGVIAEFEREPDHLSFISDENAEAVFASPSVPHLSFRLRVGVQDIDGLPQGEAERVTRSTTFADPEEAGNAPVIAVKTDTSWKTIIERGVRYVVTGSYESEKFRSNSHFALTYSNARIWVFFANY